MNLTLVPSVIVAIVAQINIVVSSQTSRFANVTTLRESRGKRAANGCAAIPWTPQYDLDGSFAAVQCKGEEEFGRCFCYSSSGSKIFGRSWWSLVKKMSCRCSRQRHRLSTVLERNDVSLHCAENGNYERLQCDNGLCWCVEPTTGKPTERFYPQLMMKYLPCYTKNFDEVEEDEEEKQQDEPVKVGEETPSWHYLRQCESKALARLAILRKLEAHGRINTHINEPLCDYDGSYAQYQIEKKRFVACACGQRIETYIGTSFLMILVNKLRTNWGPYLKRRHYVVTPASAQIGEQHNNYSSTIYCTWKDSKRIDNYQTEAVNVKRVNCNCARDQRSYADENVEMVMNCEGNGNYESQQMSNGQPYCVDADGFATTELCDPGKTLICPSSF